jgi:hypothetical protein
MKTSTIKTLAYCVLVFLALSCGIARKNSVEYTKKYVPSSQALYDSIVHMDSLLFDAFNSRDIEKLKTIFSTDVEFYHDKGGLQHYTQVIENTSKLFAQNTDVRRTIIPGSIEVYPVPGYGAVQTAMHRFCHHENGKLDCGTFKFVHTWRNEAGEWKLTRVISIDH